MLLTAGALAGSALGTTASAAPSHPGSSARAAYVPKYLFHDEFSGAHLDPTKWVHAPGVGCSALSNARVVRGVLLLRDGRTSVNGVSQPYCGVRIAASRTFLAGITVTASIKMDLPAGAHQGMFMFGTKGGWPQEGELDVTEEISRLQTSDNVRAWSADANGARCGAATNYPAGASLAGVYHVYGVHWTTTSLDFTFDGSVVFSATMAGLQAAGCTTPYLDPTNPFTLDLTNSVGGPWAGPPPADGTGYPMTMAVDWVHVTAG